ncbi:MAG: response regulator [Oscillospiraceae bacterium]|jgi:signal transduction histidine kinase/DNA-binding response OmpR family regulator|nr:response regulator [Oscillospiraceae bacterium]
MDNKPSTQVSNIRQFSVKQKFLPFSCVLFLAICAVSLLSYTISARQLNRSFIDKQLAFASETLKLRLSSTVNSELTLVRKMADSTTIRQYFLNPENETLALMARSEFNSYRAHFKNGNVFWVNDLDKIFYSSDSGSYVLDPDDPDTYWYNMTLYETETYNFNINYNPDIEKTNLWVNMPVFINVGGSEKKAIGMLGTGIDITEFSDFVVSSYREFDANITPYMFNSFNEITSAMDYNLVYDKVLVTDWLGDAGVKITQAANSRTDSGNSSFVFGDHIYMVSYIPDLNWHLVVSYPSPGLLAINGAMNAVFFGMLLLMLAIFVIGNVFVVRSDNALIEQNRQLIEANQKAEAASFAKSTFLARMSHEIRTPMNAISGMSELILREDLSPAVSEYAAGVKQASANLLAIINDILDFSKIESGKLEVISSEYQLASLLNDVITLIRVRLAEKSVRFAADIDCSLPSILIGDSVRIRQILLNILNNAVKYTNQGYILLTVSGKRDDSGGIEMSFQVSDTGIGIKSENIDKLFGDFTQFDTFANRNIEGTGLGLAITRSLCRAMGGDISASSVYGEGSVFTASFPQQIKDDSPVAKVENAASKSILIYEERDIYARSIAKAVQSLGVRCVLATSKQDFDAASRNGQYDCAFIALAVFNRVDALTKKQVLGMLDCTLILSAEFGEVTDYPEAHVISMPIHSIAIANLLNGVTDSNVYYEKKLADVSFTAPTARILIVDDIATNLKVMEGLLSPYKLRIDTCLSGREAIKLAGEKRYDFIFMDHMMPEMDGIEAAVAIRAIDDVSKTIPIIALTANAVAGMRDMFLENGFDDFLSKPIEVSKLNEIMERWIPAAKRKRVVVSAENQAPKQSISGLNIKGVNIKFGIKTTGGSETLYRKVLTVYCRDVEERLEFLREPPDADGLLLFTTNVHALKSASANIGASSLSAEAAAMEVAGKRGDISAIRENLDNFRESLITIVNRIRAVLPQETVIPEEISALDKDSLLLLKTALETEDIRTADTIINQLLDMPFEQEIANTLSEVSYHILVSEFKEAGELINRLLEEVQ